MANSGELTAEERIGKMDRERTRKREEGYNREQLIHHKLEDKEERGCRGYAGESANSGILVTKLYLFVKSCRPKLSQILASNSTSHLRSSLVLVLLLTSTSSIVPRAFQLKQYSGWKYRRYLEFRIMKSSYRYLKHLKLMSSGQIFTRVIPR